MPTHHPTNTKSKGLPMKTESTERSTAPNATHGMSHSSEYRSWANMIQSCYNQNSWGYRHYGDRGCRVHPDLMTFEGFFKVVGTRPPGTQLGLLDTQGHFTPTNLAWMSRKQIGRNRKGIKTITLGGVTDSLAAWAEASGVSASTLRGRIKRGWSKDQAISAPVKTQSPPVPGHEGALMKFITSTVHKWIRFDVEDIQESLGINDKDMDQLIQEMQTEGTTLNKFLQQTGVSYLGEGCGEVKEAHLCCPAFKRSPPVPRSSRLHQCP
jgi:hypothetical protein